MSREKYSCYEFEIKKAIVMKETAELVYTYEIYGGTCFPYYDGMIESSEWFETEAEARFAAIGHIDLLENGEE
jgi:hypothetical protein